jgi:5'-3' exonuclease
MALKSVMRDTQSIQGYVAVKGKGNFRFDIADDYKATRGNSKMEPDVKQRLDNLYQYAWDTECVQSDNCEADDVVSIWATEAEKAGNSFVIAHIDKDIDMIPGWHFNFNKNELYFIDEDTAHYKLCRQLLTGDSSDNIKGITGIGPKKSEKLLEGVAPDQMLRVVENEWRTAYGRDWEEKLNICFNLIYMRRNWDDFRKLNIKDLYQW